MTARNLPSFERSQAVRADIRALLAGRPQTLPPLSAKAIKAALGLTISERAVRRHVAAIHLEAERAELEGGRCGRVSTGSEAA